MMGMIAVQKEYTAIKDKLPPKQAVNHRITAWWSPALEASGEVKLVMYGPRRNEIHTLDLSDAIALRDYLTKVL